MFRPQQINFAEIMKTHFELNTLCREIWLPAALVLIFALPFSVPAQTASIHSALGNPSNAVANKEMSDNFLLEKPQFVLSYNKAKGGANWVSWHVEAADLGGEERGQFAPDLSLPKDWRILPRDYLNSGYDRGHLCPSGDRTASRIANDATFAMSNMLPQEGDVNRFGWAKLEGYTRDLVKRGNEAYVITGGYGSKETIANGRVNVPTNFWKVIVILPSGKNDLKRINTKTRVIAVDMPNDEGLSQKPWRDYITTVDEIETATGYDLLSKLPEAIQAAVEAKKDTGREAASPVLPTAKRTTHRRAAARTRRPATRISTRRRGGN
jgi:endonuclease G